MPRLAILLALPWLATLACSSLTTPPVPDVADAPQAPDAPDTAEDDVSRLVALAAACLPDDAVATAASLQPAGADGTWTVALRLDDESVFSTVVDPATSSCDKRVVVPETAEPLGSASSLVETCWAAAQAHSAQGAAGSPLVREPSLGLLLDRRRVSVSFPEADGAHHQPSGRDMAVSRLGGRCSVAPMD